MSYLVLARKWRPRTFSQLVGQEHVVRALRNALESERLHHAYLFTGTRGVGKTTIARILAKALNCETGLTADPCGECSACQEIDEGRFVDLIEVDAASKTKVDDTRELLDNVQFAPSGGRYKVYLIDEVHMLTKHSFNALLKTLEEPPPHVKFLLATTDPQKLPVTVLSRCLQFNLKRLTPKLIRDHLAYLCGEEGVPAEAEALALIARAADGSLRDALSILDQAIAFCGGDVQEKSVVDMLGSIDRRYVARILSMLTDGDAAGLMSTVAEIDEHFPDYGHLLDDLASALQQIAVHQVVGSTEAEGVLLVDQLADFAARLSGADLQLFYQIAITGRRDLPLAPDPRSGAEMTLLRMLAFQPDQDERAPTRPRSKATSATKSAPASGRATTGNAPQTKRQANGDAPAWSASANWSTLVRQLNLRGADQLLASNCVLLGREGDLVRFGLDQSAESYLNRSREAAMAKALSEYFSETLKVEVVVGDSENETPLQQEAREKDENLQAKRADLEADPNVVALKDMFGATLDPESVRIVDKQQSTTQE